MNGRLRGLRNVTFGCRAGVVIEQACLRGVAHGESCDTGQPHVEPGVVTKEPGVGMTLPQLRRKSLTRRLGLELHQPTFSREQAQQQMLVVSIHRHTQQISMRAIGNQVLIDLGHREGLSQRTRASAM